MVERPGWFGGIPDLGWCELPDDFTALRLAGPHKARRWRHALRGTLGAALGIGGRVVGFSRDSGYLVRRTQVAASVPRRAP